MRTRTPSRTKATKTDPTSAPAGRLSPEAAGARVGELFADHGRMVYGLCRILLRDAVEAEDAAQQVFLSAHQSLLAGTEPRDAAAWLGTIARNECRARIHARMATPLALVGDHTSLQAGVERTAGNRAEIDALCAALAELPLPQRQAFVLREFYGLSYEDVSAALGLSGGAVESLLFRARKRLQRELQPARAASGAIAIPVALQGALAEAVPGFAPSSAGGILAKLASLPAAAKLAAAAATVTAAGAIGFVELPAPDDGRAARNQRAAVASLQTRHDSRRAPAAADAPAVRHEESEGKRESRSRSEHELGVRDEGLAEANEQDADQGDQGHGSEADEEQNVDESGLDDDNAGDDPGEAEEETEVSDEGSEESGNGDD